ncbi:hypothetical protein [Acinetobacter sp.]|jgi:hypothetical protein|uniref:hypothetical protein n=1 Tax=Acinetobacter sp. TaxID=472 RepID=UPI0035B053CA
MKKMMGLALSAMLISGCAALPESGNVGTSGLLLCEANELCPAVLVGWNEQKKDVLDMKISLNSVSHYYTIKHVSFSNGQKTLDFTPAAATEQAMILGMYRSRAFVTVPVKLMAELKVEGQKEDQNITMSLETDRGTITRYVLRNGQESSLFQQFKQVYSGS